jgi:hypothetical protein
MRSKTLRVQTSISVQGEGFCTVQGVVLEQGHAQGLAVRDQLHFDLVVLVTVLVTSRGALRRGYDIDCIIGGHRVICET